MKKTTLFIFLATTLVLLATVSCKEETLNLTPPESSAWEAQTRTEIDGLNRKSMKVLSSTESSLEMELTVANYALHTADNELFWRPVLGSHS